MIFVLKSDMVRRLPAVLQKSELLVAGQAIDKWLPGLTAARPLASGLQAVDRQAPGESSGVDYCDAPIAFAAYGTAVEPPAAALRPPPDRLAGP